jgi:hypothetical protein
MARWPPPIYRFRMEFDVPVAFAFRWCTDYRPDDSRRSREHFERHILRKTRRTVVYEDLWREGRGWGWRHQLVTLDPPNHWHADSYGNIRHADVDYRLSELPGGRSRMDIVFRRRPSPVYPKQPSQAAWHADLEHMWTNYHRAMVRDFRATTGRRAARAVR